MEIVVIVLLTLLNGLFSMSEIALVSARKFKLESAVKKGSESAKKALELSNNPNTFLSAVQIGITLIGILVGIFSGESFKQPLADKIAQIPSLALYSDTIALIIILIILTFVQIVFGELLPKRIGMLFPEKIATTMAQPMTAFSIITKPFIWLLTKTNDMFLNIFGLKYDKEGFVSEEEIKAMISESTESGEIQQIEQSIVNRVFALGDRKVSELMTHRNDIVWFDIDESLESIKEKAAQEIHSVYPVSNKELDKIEGIISIKDIFPENFKGKKFNLRDYLKKPIIIPENTMAYSLMEKFKQNKIHYAIVVDEYGSFEGMLTMDDVLDALVGDMSEYNQEDYTIVQRDENSWLADGQFPFYEFLHYFDLEEPEIDGDYNTLGGFIIHSLQSIPSVGEKMSWRNFQFEVVDMDGNRIDKILVSTTKDEAEK